MIKKIYWFLFVYDLNDSPGNTAAIVQEPWGAKLRRDIAGLVLFSYILLIFNTMMPFFADVVAHTFWEKEHLLTVHKTSGKYHVHLDIVNAAKQSDKDKSSGNLKSGSEDYQHIVPLSAYNFSSTAYFIKRPYISYLSHNPISYPDIDSPPPRA